MRKSSSSRRARRALAATAVAVALPLALTACGEAAEQATEKAIEQAAEENGEKVDVDLDEDGGYSVEGEDGSFSSGAKIPDDFPDDVPVVGEVTYGIANESDGTKSWQLAATEDGSAQDVYAEAKSALEDAGFEVGEGQEYGELATLSNGEYEVVLSVGDNGDGSAGISYAVTESA
ncbi:hypothetical protein [Nocardioides sp. SYSU DS0651]|uniref:hypothetical protein n=1 Tax=Nocardioides sp. SYSU DS0651 TaxID=3415955 RepID=UPI003F4BF35A